MPKLFTQQFHAYIDYPVALGLIIFPFLLSLGDVASTLSIVTGVAALILTILTNHETGIVKVLPYSLHLVVDGIVGVAFILIPFLFGLAGLDAAYFWVLGATVLVVVGLHKPA